MKDRFSTADLGAQVSLLQCSGELDLMSRPDLVAGLNALIRTGASRLVVDLSGVTFMDCGSVGALEVAVRGLDPERSLFVVVPNGIVARLFSVLDVDPALLLTDTLEDAVAGRARNLPNSPVAG